VSENYDRARAEISKHRDALMRIADELLTREVLDGDQVNRIVAGETLTPIAPGPTAPTAIVTAAPVADASRPAGVVPPPLQNPLPQQP